MKKYTPWIALAVGTYLAFLIAKFPAATAIRLFAPESLRTTNVSGTIWSGSADLASVPGLALRNLAWQIKARRLLILQPSGNISADLAPGFVNSAFTISRNKARLQDMQVSTSISAFSDVLPISGANGSISATLSEISFIDNWPASATGQLRVSNMLVEPLGGARDTLIPLGNLQIDLTTDENDIIAGAIKDLGGPLEIEGTLKLSPPRLYEIEALVKPRADAPETLVQALMFMTEDPDANGRRKLKQSGSL